jgi:DNA polymerase kappa
MCQYEARKYGVRSGMAEFVARKLCPHLIVYVQPLSASAESLSVSNNFDLYIDASKSVREVLMQVRPNQTALLRSQYDENLMMASLDEGYLK